MNEQNAQTESRQTAIANLHMLLQYSSGQARPKNTEEPRQRYSRVLSFLMTGQCAPSPNIEAHAFAPTRWEITESIYVERRRQPDGIVMYAVCDGGNELDKDGEWSLPPSPSNRDEEYLQAHRWNTFDEAVRAATATIQ